MKKYHIYGMGNALVDMEFQVGDQQLQELEIDKGHMTLVSRERQEEILKVLGNSMAQACGGSAANSLIAAKQWGAKTFYSCKVADDDEGIFYLNDLKRHGVDSLERRSDEGITGKCLVMVTADAQRSMNTCLGVSEKYCPEEIDGAALRGSEYLYIEGYLVASPPSKEAAVIARQMAKASGVKVALTFSDINMLSYFRSEMDEVLGDGVDILFANEEEILAFSKKSNLFEAIKSMKSLAKILAITRGPQGALIWDGKQIIEIPTISVQAVDTNGAGDMFAGTFLWALSEGKLQGEIRRAGQIACFYASHVVEKWGPRLNDEEAKRAMKHVLEKMGTGGE